MSAPDRFQVDLAGMVDLLSHHLYTGPQVYLRELLQNAVDAVTARRKSEPDAPGTIRLRPLTAAQGPTLEVTDSGTGLDADEARTLLATIGLSSKKDTLLGVGRAEYIGQFGIGLLAAYLVAESVEVVSRSSRPGSATVRWVGRSDGTFTLDTLADSRDVGTTVRLVARRGAEHWLDPATVVALASDYGSLLDADVAVEVDVLGTGPRWRRITEPELPWKASYSTPHARGVALASYCEKTFGFTPMGSIDLDAPLAGVSGVAFILPEAVAPAAGRHRVYTKRMLLGSRVTGVLPDWAFFVRAVINSDLLAPTASRESLQEDEILLATRDELGNQLKAWAVKTLTSDTPLASSFIRTHHLALRALALDDDELLDVAARVLPFETTDGRRTLADVASSGTISFASTTEDYRSVAAVARAQGLTVVNAGYVYDADLLRKLGKRHGYATQQFAAGDLTQAMGLLPTAREVEVAEALARARQLLDGDDCDVIVRAFEPVGMPAVLLRDPEGDHRRALEREREATPGLWGGLLDTFSEVSSTRSRTLALNDNTALVRQLLRTADGEIFAAGLQALFLSAVLQTGEPLHHHETAALNEALGVLLAASLEHR